MSATSKVVIGLSSTAIGFGVPVACLYFVVNYGFNYWIAGAIACMAVLFGGAILIVGITTGPLGETDNSGRIERERLNLLRNQQRATLEEMDNIVTILMEIRDSLKSVEA